MIDTRPISRIKSISKIAVYESIDSTNRAGVALVRRGISDFIIIALRQQRGRGRMGRQWLSGEGGAYFSLGVSTEKMERPQMLTFICAKAIMDMLISMNMEPCFKWPNDVFVNGRKISGVLIELVNNIAVCGIGINVNNEIAHENINAISMKEIKGEKIPLEDVISSCAGNIFSILDNMEVIDGFLQNSTMNGRPVSIKTLAGTVKGTVKGFNPDGAIILRTQNGIREFYEGDLSLEDL